MGLLEMIFGRRKKKVNKVQHQPLQRPKKNEIVKKGLIIKNEMVVEIRKKGSLYKAFDESGVNYSSVVSKKRREQAWQKNKSLKAKISQNADLVTWRFEDGSFFLDKLISKYGEKNGKAILKGRLLKGMNVKMVREVLGKEKYIDNNEYYFGKPFTNKITFKDNKMLSNIKLKDKVWLDMSKECLVASLGKPKHQLKEISKEKKKEKLFFGSRKTRQGNIAYNLEVRMENDIVIGWKELE